MSEEKPKRKSNAPKKIKVEHKVSSKTHRNENTSDEKDRVKALFMESSFVQWTPFAEKMKWDPMISRQRYPVSEWVAEKKQIIAQKEAEHISQLIFEHKGRWHREVLKTLRDYPKAIDTLFAVTNAKINGMAQDAKDDINFPKPDGTKRLDKYKPSDFMLMATAIKSLSEAKYKSLLLHDWNVRVAEQESNPEALSHAGEQDDGNWVVEIKGGEKIKGAEFEAVIAEFYDKPSAPVAIPEASSPIAEDEDA